jgi:hypothetical protein
MNQKSFWLVIITVGILTLVGCNVYLAASQPPKVDLDAFSQSGVTRDVIVAERGTPTSSVMHENGTRTDVYEFYKVSATGWKVVSVAFHASTDVSPLLLGEIIGTLRDGHSRGQAVSPLTGRHTTCQLIIGV